jgi:hypothetical protein
VLAPLPFQVCTRSALLLLPTPMLPQRTDCLSMAPVGTSWASGNSSSFVLHLQTQLHNWSALRHMPWHLCCADTSRHHGPLSCRRARFFRRVLQGDEQQHCCSSYECGCWQGWCQEAECPASSHSFPAIDHVVSHPRHLPASTTKGNLSLAIDFALPHQPPM